MKQQHYDVAKVLRDGEAQDLKIRNAHAVKVRTICSQVAELAEANILETADERLLEIINDPNTNINQTEIEETELFLLMCHADAGHIPEELFKIRQALSGRTPAKSAPDPALNTAYAQKYWQKQVTIIFCADHPATAQPSIADILRHIEQHRGIAPDRQTVTKWIIDPDFLSAVEERRTRPARRQEAIRDMNLRRAIAKATDYRWLAKFRKVLERAAELPA